MVLIMLLSRIAQDVNSSLDSPNLNQTYDSPKSDESREN